VEGFADTEFSARTGLSADVLEMALARVRALGLVDHAGGRWRASARGFRFLNEILVDLLPVRARATSA